MYYMNFVSNYLRLCLFKAILRCKRHKYHHKSLPVIRAVKSAKYKVFNKCGVDLLLETII